MKIDEIKALYEKYEDDFLEFEKVENKKSKRVDIHAMLLMDELVPGDENIVSAASHDMIYFGVDAKVLARVMTEEHVLELIRCGVSFSSDENCFYKFT